MDSLKRHGDPRAGGVWVSFVRPLWLAGLLALATAAAAPLPAAACGGVASTGMGGAALAVTQDAWTAICNPAGLVHLAGRAVTFLHTLTNRDSDGVDNGFIYAEPDYGTGAGALSWVYRTTVVGYDAAADRFRYEREHGLGYAVGRRLDRQTAFGFQIRYARLNRDMPGGGELQGGRYALDLAGWHRTGGGAAVGAIVRNAVGTPARWSDGSEEAAPLAVDAGLSLRPLRGLTMAADVTDLLETSGSRGIRIGAQYEVRPFLALRAGWRALGIGAAERGWTAGLGYRFGGGFLNYAYLDGQPAGTHQVEVGWQF